MKLRIAVLDDNKADCIQVLDFIYTYASLHQCEIETFEFENPADFFVDFRNKKFDIIFLDIYLKDANGIQIAEQVRQKDTHCLIIFSTCSQSYAISGYRVQAFDYLLKPYHYDDFSKVFKRAQNTLQKNEKVPFIRVKEGRIFLNIPVDYILYTDYFNHYVQIHTQERMIRSYIPFKEFSALLSDYPQFLCCYRNCMVNMDKVNHIEERDFVMQNGERVPIARAKHNELKQHYADYIFEKLTKEDSSFVANTTIISSHRH